MDFHLTRGLRLKAETEYKNLYQWAINEIDAEGHAKDRDQIPWPWTLYFRATSCALYDNLGIKTKAAPEQSEVEKSQVISITLRPGGGWSDDDLFSRTSYSMFGTDRNIESFQLDIYRLADPVGAEGCTAWGSVSYTSEIDFRKQTTDDCIWFYLSVKPDTFARYASMIAHGLVDEVIFSVGSVDGFYSDWSPGISTGRVKVLTTGTEQKVAIPPGIQFEPPRLGHVGKVFLQINRRLEFAKPRALDNAEPRADGGTVRVVPETRMTPAVVEPQTLKMLGSIKRAAWFVVFFLALIFIATLSR